MGVISRIFANTRRPEGWIGRVMVAGMNGGSHAKLAVWGLFHAPFQGDETVLDCGCGGGANISRMLKLCGNGQVHGVDYSPVSVETSRKVNAKAIKAGRCTVTEGDAADLPFGDAVFDRVTAFETVYFWPELEAAFREVHRVLKTGGIFLSVNESDGKHKKSTRWTNIIEGMHVYTGEDLRVVLLRAGFAEVEMDDDEQHDRLCVKAVK